MKAPRQVPRRALLLLALFGAVAAAPARAETDPETGLIKAPGWEAVKAQCGVCHSHKLVTAQRGDGAFWTGLIRWMQAKHGLWPLGEFETPILDYLASHYAPARVGRRQPLTADLLLQLEAGASSSNGSISH